MRALKAFMVSCVLLGSQACASDPVTVFRVSPVASSFLVRLPANATTGFRWYLVKKPSWMQVVGSHYSVPSKARIGEGGASEWDIRWPESHCFFPQRVELVFAYTRPWLGASSDEKQTHITVYCSPTDKVKSPHVSHTKGVGAEVM